MEEDLLKKYLDGHYLGSHGEALNPIYADVFLKENTHPPWPPYFYLEKLYIICQWDGGTKLFFRFVCRSVLNIKFGISENNKINDK